MFALCVFSNPFSSEVIWFMLRCGHSTNKQHPFLLKEILVLSFLVARNFFIVMDGGNLPRGNTFCGGCFEYLPNCITFLTFLFVYLSTFWTYFQEISYYDFV